MGQNIINALLVIIPIGFLLGVALAFFSAKFAVKENEKAKEIRAVLPSVNCGACGFAGCDDYALAIAEGKAEPNLCVPGAADVANKIGEYLGIEVPAPKNVVAFVSCNGNCDATGKKANYEGINTCDAAAKLYGGPCACNFACIGFGDCAAHIAGHHTVIFPVDQENGDVAVLHSIQRGTALKPESAEDPCT